MGRHVRESRQAPASFDDSNQATNHLTSGGKPAGRSPLTKQTKQQGQRSSSSLVNKVSETSTAAQTAAAGRGAPASGHTQLAAQLLAHSDQGGVEGLVRVEAEVGAQQRPQARALVDAVLADLVQDGWEEGDVA